HRRALEALGLRVELAPTPRDAIDRWREPAPTLLLLDCASWSPQECGELIGEGRAGAPGERAALCAWSVPSLRACAVDWGTLQLLESTPDRPVAGDELAAFVSRLVGLEAMQHPEPEVTLALRSAEDRSSAASHVEQLLAPWQVAGAFKDRARTVVDELATN